MSDAQTGAPCLRMRPAGDGDEPFVTALSGEVFNVFGEYDDFLPRYLGHPDVMTTITEADSEPAGFTMLALVVSEQPMPWQPPLDTLPEMDPEDRVQPIWVDAELVAIAVAPAWQGRGIGRQQLQFVIDFVASTAAARNLRSLQLNVADTNTRARAFFETMDFVVVDDEDGRYPRGQRSLRMARRV